MHSTPIILVSSHSLLNYHNLNCHIVIIKYTIDQEYHILIPTEVMIFVFIIVIKGIWQWLIEQEILNPMQFIYYLLNNSYIYMLFSKTWVFVPGLLHVLLWTQIGFFYHNSNFKLVSYIRYIYKTLRLGFLVKKTNYLCRKPNGNSIN